MKITIKDLVLFHVIDKSKDDAIKLRDDVLTIFEMADDVKNGQSFSPSDDSIKKIDSILKSINEFTESEPLCQFNEDTDTNKQLYIIKNTEIYDLVQAGLFIEMLLHSLKLAKKAELPFFLPDGFLWDYTEGFECLFPAQQTSIIPFLKPVSCDGDYAVLPNK